MVIHACNSSATELTQKYCQFGDQPRREADAGETDFVSRKR